MARLISLKPSTTPHVRSSTRLLAMVHELHKAGYQRLRVSPGLAPSGMYWRCSITHAGNIAENGWSLRTPGLEGEVASYSSGAGDRYFGWDDAPGRSARELAVRFIQRFPALVEKGDGCDWAYAGWLTDVLGRAELGGADALPVFYADYPLTLDPEWLPPPP
ncbi:hypothetical protein [Sphingomonas jatrophae]|uniref:Uncharacterized protein n=1 Tax=Sphingomonas jatrophae TaxID=1166337 RepID=A0A1I6KY08_9SPHN|nr:hypothetical protein [Sphingomonas jatrophae]SFR96133.1 hypothetical protein SAMN05192580_1930 [Sphingomonas jatrophae]